MLFLRMFGAKGYLTEGQYKKWKGHRHIPWIIRRNDKKHLSKYIFEVFDECFTHVIIGRMLLIEFDQCDTHIIIGWINGNESYSNLTQPNLKWDQFSVWAWDTKIVINVIIMLKFIEM